MTLTVYSVVSAMSPCYIGVSAVVQQLFAMAWFGCIVYYLDRYYLAADKGVRRFEYAIQHYPSALVALTSLLSAAVRSMLVTAVATAFDAKTMMDYEAVAVIVAAVGMMGLHRHFACQRPVQLLLTEGGFEMAAAMLAALVAYGMQPSSF